MNLNLLTLREMNYKILQLFSFCSSKYSLPSKKEELRQIARVSNSAVIGLSQTKLGKTIFDYQVSIPN